MELQGIHPKGQELLDAFAKSKTDESVRDRLMNEPLKVLEEIGIAVDPQLQDAVVRGMQAAAFAYSSQPEIRPLEPLRPAQPQRGFARAAKRSIGIDFQNHFHISAEWWGVVVKVDHAAIKELPKGIDAIGTLAEAAMKAVQAAAESGGPLAVIVVLGLAYWGAVFTAYVVLLPEIDKGKGVYLTITWPQFALFGSSGGLIGPALLPIPTTVV